MLGTCWEITWNHHFQAISRTSSHDLPGKDGVAFHRPSHRSGHVLGCKGPLGQGLGVFHRRMVPSGRVPWLLWTFGELMLSNIWWNSVKLWYQLNNTCFPFFDPEHALIRSHVGGQKLVGGWKFKIVVLMSNSLPGMILWSPMTVETSVPSLYLSISCNTIIIYHYISNLSESISLVAWPNQNDQICCSKVVTSTPGISPRFIGSYGVAGHGNRDGVDGRWVPLNNIKHFQPSFLPLQNTSFLLYHISFKKMSAWLGKLFF